MCFCWHSAASVSSYGVLFAAMNFSVHAVMYFFYFLTSLGYRPSKYAMPVTLAQIAQMFVGTGIATYVAARIFVLDPPQTDGTVTAERRATTTLFPSSADRIAAVDRQLATGRPFEGPQCNQSGTNALAGFLMYASYLYLFCAFFYTAYIRKPAAKKNKLAKAA